MLHWITLTADMLTEVIDRAELEAITAADTKGTVVPGIIQDVTAAVREAIAGNAANVMDLQSDTTIPRTLKPEALDMIAWRLLKRFAVSVSEDRDKANTAAHERLEAVPGRHPPGDRSGRPHARASRQASLRPGTASRLRLRSAGVVPVPWTGAREQILKTMPLTGQRSKTKTFSNL